VLVIGLAFCQSSLLATRGQSAKKTWYDFRAGRITASKMKSACQTNVEKPSISQLKSVCYPTKMKFKTTATEWGTQKKAVALDKYRQHVSTHQDVSLEKCGLVIHPEHGHVAASPDSLVVCSCCGSGVVEVKCPYKDRLQSVSDYICGANSCFRVSDNGDIDLKWNMHIITKCRCKCTCVMPISAILWCACFHTMHLQFLLNVCIVTQHFGIIAWKRQMSFFEFVCCQS